jgi:hypothetical protein
MRRWRRKRGMKERMRGYEDKSEKEKEEIQKEEECKERRSIRQKRIGEELEEGRLREWRRGG